MSSTSAADTISSLQQPDLTQVSARAEEICEKRLRSSLEPVHIGEVVAIHVESGDFAVGKNSPTARRALRERHGEGMIVTMSVGADRPEPALDRILGGDY